MIRNNHFYWRSLKITNQVLIEEVSKIIRYTLVIVVSPFVYFFRDRKEFRWYRIPRNFDSEFNDYSSDIVTSGCKNIKHDLICRNVFNITKCFLVEIWTEWLMTPSSIWNLKMKFWKLLYEEHRFKRQYSCLVTYFFILLIA